jgi:hypothetical protein
MPFIILLSQKMAWETFYEWSLVLDRPNFINERTRHVLLFTHFTTGLHQPRINPFRGVTIGVIITDLFQFASVVIGNLAESAVVIFF